MKRGAIITLYGLYNYGNRLQNYALYETLNKCGICPISFISVNSITQIKITILRVLKKRIGLIHRTDLFRSFNKKYIKSKNIFRRLDRIQQKYDFFICGSDQIWHPKFGGTPYYFAYFAKPYKRIAYSASFGVSELPCDVKDRYAKYLSEMKAISVREETGAKIIKDLTGKDVPVLVDPTMLLEQAEWRKITRKPTFYKNKKYILTYFLGNVDMGIREYIDSIEKKYGLEIINLEERSPNMYWYKTGPAQFLWLVDHCELMCTDSFHGSVFSILMDVPFIVFDRKDKQASMSSRIDTLLHKFQLENRKFDSVKNENIFEKNYDHISQILEYEREKSVDFLKKAMELD